MRGFLLFNRSGQISSVIRSMERKSKRRIVVLVAIQILASVLELIAIGLIGIIGIISIGGMTSKARSNKVDFVLSFFGIEDKSLQLQVAFVSLLFIIILAFKTILVMLTSRKILDVLTKESTRASSQLLKFTLNSSAKKIDSDSKNYLSYLVNDGVDRTFLSLIANLCNLVSDLFMLFAVFSFMLIIDVKTTVFAGIFFGLVGWPILKRQQKIGQDTGRIAMELKIGIADKTFESFRIKRELILRGLISEYIVAMEETKNRFNAANAKIIFLPAETRYFMEFSIIIGTILVCALQFMQRDSVQAFGGIAIFLAAATRSVPAILRVQNEVVTIRAVQRSVSKTLDLIPLANTQSRDIPNQVLGMPSKYDIKFENVSFSYDISSPEIIKCVSFYIPQNDYVVITGESGEGKSTLIDLILGEVDATSGTVFIGDLPSKLVCANARGSIAFVPQKVQLVNGTVYQNISLKRDLTSSEIERIDCLLSQVNLLEDLLSLPDGLMTNLGDQGSIVSVGQQQRIGIVRALYTNPKLLILDEATSSLDETNERVINSMLRRMRGSLTILVIAHRQITISSADRELRLSQGKISEIFS